MEYKTHKDFLSTEEGRTQARMKVKELKARLDDLQTPYFSNDNISAVVSKQDQEAIVANTAVKMQHVLDSLLINTKEDHNTQETALRWAKMAVYEIFQGRYNTAPSVTTFPNVKKVNQMYVVGPIELRSVCAHHLVPISGKAYIGMLPSEEGALIGLSKFHRTVRHYAERPQIQEEMVIQIADALEELTSPSGLAVVVKAHHHCCSHRGVKDNESLMISSELRGNFLTSPEVRSEFMGFVNR